MWQPAEELLKVWYRVNLGYHLIDREIDAKPLADGAQPFLPNANASLGSSSVRSGHELFDITKPYNAAENQSRFRFTPQSSPEGNRGFSSQPFHQLAPARRVSSECASGDLRENCVP
jgi:hypothetical protein